MAVLREQFGLSQDALATTLGKSRPAVANALRLLSLSAEAQEALEKGHISAGHARAVLSLGSSDAQSELLRHCIHDSLSVRDAEYAAVLWKEEGVFPWLQVEDEDAAGMQEQQAGVRGAAAEQPKAQRKVKSPLLQNMQKQLRQTLKLHASINGTEARGRISLSYQSREELHTLLRRLGLDALDVQHPDTA